MFYCHYHYRYYYCYYYCYYNCYYNCYYYYCCCCCVLWLLLTNPMFFQWGPVVYGLQGLPFPMKILDIRLNICKW